MKELYHAYARYLNGSTDEVTDVYLNSTDSQKRALEICDEYAQGRKGMIRTWLKKQGRTNEYCAKSYI
jgi:hypothetical protein